ncbi:MAG: hypothetical protein R3F53_21630 [Gammaproteobacteria bacterium]
MGSRTIASLIVMSPEPPPFRWPICKHAGGGDGVELCVGQAQRVDAVGTARLMGMVEVALGSSFRTIRLPLKRGDRVAAGNAAEVHVVGDDLDLAVAGLHRDRGTVGERLSPASVALLRDQEDSAMLRRDRAAGGDGPGRRVVGLDRDGLLPGCGAEP